PHRGPVNAEDAHQMPERPLDWRVRARARWGGEQSGQLGEERLEMKPLGEALLGPAALGALDQQAPDQRALDQERSGDTDDVPAVAPPEGRLPEQPGAVGWKPAGIEPPPSKLSSVEHRYVRARVGRGRTSPRQHPQSQLRDFLTVRLEIHHIPSDGADS